MCTNYENLPIILEVKDIATILKISRNTAYELVHSKDFPKIAVGRQYRIPRSKFIEWLESGGAA